MSMKNLNKRTNSQPPNQVGGTEELMSLLKPRVTISNGTQRQINLV